MVRLLAISLGPTRFWVAFLVGAESDIMWFTIAFVDYDTSQMTFTLGAHSTVWSMLFSVDIGEIIA